ncbi:glycosyltransferase family 1 protein [Costertonia aggregata]|uniref:Glycosyltransferase family 1 protein n=1 Tax=Costertonia aggregata TaxID=343403 RepID=A0A7H9ATF0_9FLAO|nr:glycosyltransferase family 1 protein [Costertonia aggregata]QLG46696.1 glycosyltransferase family 1 protein [Costertonia aggregata]
MQPERILQVFTTMGRGGAESMIMNYYRKIDRSKIQFDFLVHREEKGDFEDEIIHMGGKIYRMPAINPVTPKKYYAALRVFFKEHKNYRIVHSHLNTFSSFPLKIAKEFNIACRIAHAHIALEKIQVSDLKKPKEALKKVVKLQLRKNVKKYASHLFSCGTKAGEWLFGSGVSFKTMNNAIDTSKFAYNAQLAKKYSIDMGLEGKLVLGHIGRFNDQKNHLFLLEIFAETLKKNPECTLLLIGDGTLQKTIKAKAKSLGVYDKVHFMGVRSNIHELIQVMDVFVFPSFYEGLPVTLIEAQAAGLQVVASDTITKEVALTPNIEFVSLDQSPSYWASTILNHHPVQKKDNTELIVKGNYDIHKNVQDIQAFYSSQIV